MKPISLKAQRILMWIPYLNLLNPWLIWAYQRKALGQTGWNKQGLTAYGLMFLIFLPTAVLVQLLPDAVWISWAGFYLAGLLPSLYLIRVQEKLAK